MKKGFSLIELLISLIVISLLITAFMPIITKKLIASSVTVGNFSKTTQTERNVTKSDCDGFDAIFIPASSNVLKPLCVMKYNVGDGKYEESYSGVQKCSAGNSCTVENGSSTTVTKDNLTPTCWVGTTSSSCNSNYGNYDGCTRTVCNWTGADKLCSNIGWRLPTQEELQSFTNTTYSSDVLASDGLMFCDGSSSSMAPLCAQKANNCTGTYNNYCYPYHIWSSTFSSNSMAYDRTLGTNWSDGTGRLNEGFSARCVLDSIVEEIKTPDKNDNETVDFEKPSKEFCEKFDAMYIPASMTGTSDLCVTKYNVGDITSSGSGPTIAEGVNVLGVNQSCTTGNCCWKGQTGSPCSSSGNGEGENASNYSGCTRTVCQYFAAFSSCNMWAPKGLPTGSWRLPTSVELSILSTNIDALNKNQGINGLQLCDAYSGYGADTCYFVTSCLGAPNNYCRPYALWSQNTDGTGQDYYLGKGTISLSQQPNSNAGSIRCVYDGKINTIGIETDKDKQAICNKYNALYVPSKYNGTTEDLCVTKYNVGDDNGPTYSNYEALEISMIAAGTSCPKANYCCFQGKTASPCTASGNGNSTYSGCNRTVCQYNAAKILCENWNPDGTTAGKWRLPTASEVAIWATNIDALNKNQGINGLQLCDAYSGYGADTCYFVTSCLGAPNNYCRPYALWSQNTDGTGQDYYLDKGTISLSQQPNSNAGSIRCVSSEVLKE